MEGFVHRKLEGTLMDLLKTVINLAVDAMSMEACTCIQVGEVVGSG
jgi:hypothetical protein